jgi:hypothetical protein
MSARNKLRAAIAKRDRLTDEMEAASAKRADLLASAEAAKAEAVGLERDSIDREATALLSGEDGPKKAADEERRIDELRKQARTARRAAELATIGIEQLHAQVSAADVAISDVVLADFRANRDGARVAALEIVASLVPHLARLVAADHVRRTFIGDRYRFEATDHPPAELWSGEIVARAFAKALPDRLRPEGFAETIDAVAKSIAAETLELLKEKTK